jgi:hypothetical protein
MALKLDMSKAYDRVEWDFLEAMLRKFEFANRWIDLVMACARSLIPSLLMANRMVEYSPLSPYFFIMCAEAMSSMIHHATATGQISGVLIPRGHAN